MLELPTTIALFDNELFKKCIGTSKGALKGHCPECKERLAYKGGQESEATMVQTGPASAKCFMCEADLDLEEGEDACTWCGSNSKTVSSPDAEPCCFGCGHW